LSSWLRRIAMAYGLKLRALVHQDMGCPSVDICKLDLNPPDDLLKTVAARTGTPLETVRKTALEGLFQYILLRSPEECSVLFSLCDRALPVDEFQLNWEQWIKLFRKRPFRGCRSCLSKYPDAAVLLAWRLPVMLSCPIHRLMLEPVRFCPNELKWRNDKSEAVPESLSLHDCRTWSALTNGYIDLPGGRVAAFSWFKALGMILDVLDSRLEDPGPHPEGTWKETVRDAACDLLDGMPWKTKIARMDALFLASAIGLMERGTIPPVGLDASYFSLVEV
jgi:hypothetical protein